ncbi:MAG: hypothetical protein LBQ09_03035 [Acidobacteriaceae bacterium]|jgi:hypothetical protein|nr:hypothetical protein [Acidobacteriaceae bacterium]
MTKNTSSTSETTLETFAEDLGHVLGKAQNKAESWLNQRVEIIKQLEGVRDMANGLLRQLGGGTPVVRAERTLVTTERRPSTLSPEARERIAAAQRRRWAKFRREQNK